jgi:multiple sugar transport system ATP-binding protein
MNFVRGAIEREDGRARFTAPGFTLSLADAGTARPGPVVLGVRPHDLSLGGSTPESPRGVVTLVEPLGSEQLVYVSIRGGANLVAAIGEEPAPRVDEAVALNIALNAVHLFDPESGGRIPLGADGASGAVR